MKFSYWWNSNPAYLWSFIWKQMIMALCQLSTIKTQQAVTYFVSQYLIVKEVRGKRKSDTDNLIGRYHRAIRESIWDLETAAAFCSLIPTRGLTGLPVIKHMHYKVRKKMLARENKAHHYHGNDIWYLISIVKQYSVILIDYGNAIRYQDHYENYLYYMLWSIEQII